MQAPLKLPLPALLAIARPAAHFCSPVAIQLKLSLPFGLSQAALRSRMPVVSL